MTKTAMKFRELNELERHNKELERQGVVKNVISGITSGITSVLGKGGVPGLLSTAKSLLDPSKFELFKKLYQLKASGTRLGNKDFKTYVDLLQEVKGHAG